MPNSIPSVPIRTEKGRKRKYIAGLAQLNFKVKLDWSFQEAQKLYIESIKRKPIPDNNSEIFKGWDEIIYEDAINGMKKIPDNSIDLIIADPPFGIGFSGKENLYNRKSSNVIDGYREVKGDYYKFSRRWISQIPRILKSTGSAYIFSGWTNLRDILNAIADTDLILINHIIWKYQFGVFTKRKFVTSHYHILFLVKDEKRYFFNKYEYYPEDVWIIPRKYNPGQIKNGTKLPEDLIVRIIQFSSKPGDLIFDPFMGNATTAVCAKGLFRHFIGFEINEKLKPLHDHNLSKTEPGCYYKPLNTYLPKTEDLLKKYPHLKKYIELKTNEVDEE